MHMISAYDNVITDIKLIKPQHDDDDDDDSDAHDDARSLPFNHYTSAEDDEADILRLSSTDDDADDAEPVPVPALTTVSPPPAPAPAATDAAIRCCGCCLRTLPDDDDDEAEADTVADEDEDEDDEVPSISRSLKRFRPSDRVSWKDLLGNCLHSARHRRTDDITARDNNTHTHIDSQHEHDEHDNNDDNDYAKKDNNIMLTMLMTI